MKLTCPRCRAAFLVDARAIGPQGRRVKCGQCGHIWHADPTDDPRPDIGTSRDPVGSVSPPLSERGPEREPAWQAESADRGLDAAPTAEPADVPWPQNDAGGGDAPPSNPDDSLPASGPYTDEETIPIGRNLPAVPRRRGFGMRLAMGWLLLIAVVGGVLSGGYIGRDAIVAAWPPAVRLYDTLGIAVSPSALRANSMLAPQLEIRINDQEVVDSPNGSVLVIRGEVINSGQGARNVPPLRVTLIDAADSALARSDFTAPLQQLGPGESVGFRTTIPGFDPATARVVIDAAPPPAIGVPMPDGAMPRPADDAQP